MDAQPRRPRLTLAIAPAAACVAGGVVAALLLLMPAALLEGVVSDSGLPGVLAAAAPPLGFTARVALAGVFGGGTALVGWFALFLMFGTRSVMLGARAGRIVRRSADAHPDAPPRRPLFARQELGIPFLEIHASAERMLASVAENTPPIAEPAAPPTIPPPAPAEPEPVPVPVPVPVPAAVLAQPAPPAPAPPVERALPTDLDQPLAAFHPGAIFRAATPTREQPAAPRAGSIDDLLARLERGIVRPAAPDPAPPAAERKLGDVLESLRQLAASGR